MPMILKIDRGEGQRGGGRRAVVEGRQQDPVGDATDDVGAGDGHPAVQAAAQDGEQEDPGLLRDGTADVAEPAPDDGLSAARHRCPLRLVAHAEPVTVRGLVTPSNGIATAFPAPGSEDPLAG
jgi:hypothetical protein